MQNVADFKAKNDSILRINLKQPFPPFLGLLAMKYCSVVPKEAIDFYGRNFRANPVGTGAFQFRKWIENQALILVKNGCLMTYYEDPNKTKHVIQFSLMGWWTGDFKSKTENSPSKYTIRAMENSTYCSLDLETYEQVCKEIPVLETYFRRLFQTSVVSHQDRIIRNISYSAEARYEAFVESQPKLEQLVAQKYIASYLGMSPEFLSKIKARRYAGGK